MKLVDWAKKEGISYLTSYRWFKNGNLPVPAYQTESGTIIVQEEENKENLMSTVNVKQNTSSSESLSHFLKKTVEFSKNNASIEDFASYVLSNFTLQVINTIEKPKYSKNKPSNEEVQENYKKIIKNNKVEKPTPLMFLPDEKLLSKIDNINETDPEVYAGKILGVPHDILQKINPELKQDMAKILEEYGEEFNFNSGVTYLSPNNKLDVNSSCFSRSEPNLFNNTKMQLNINPINCSVNSSDIGMTTSSLSLDSLNINAHTDSTQGIGSSQTYFINNIQNASEESTKEVKRGRGRPSNKNKENK